MPRIRNPPSCKAQKNRGAQHFACRKILHQRNGRVSRNAGAIEVENHHAAFFLRCFILLFFHISSPLGQDPFFQCEGTSAKMRPPQPALQARAHASREKRMHQQLAYFSKCNASLVLLNGIIATRKLRIVQISIEPFLRKQLLMSSLLDNITIVDDQYQICVTNS